MGKKMIVAIAALLAATAVAAIDVNQATQAELESVTGIGPVLSTLIIAERNKSQFKDWNDLASRVKGVSGKSSDKLSRGGLTVGGVGLTGRSTSGAPDAASAAAKE